MKNAWIFGICLFVLSTGIVGISTTVPAQTPPAARYNEAGALYRDGHFTESLKVYEEIIESSIDHPDLYYNASNAAYRAGFIGKAILYLERAHKLAPSDDDILSNMTFLNSVKEDQEQENSNVILAYLNRHYTVINVNTAALWSGCSFTLAMILCTAALFMKKWMKMAMIVMSLLFGLIFIISTGILLDKIHHSATVEEGIVMVEEAPAYSGPGDDNTHIFTIHEGTKVIIERSQSAWSLIRLKSGAGGWLKNELIERI